MNKKRLIICITVIVVIVICSVFIIYKNNNKEVLFDQKNNIVDKDDNDAVINKTKEKDNDDTDELKDDKNNDSNTIPNNDNNTKTNNNTTNNNSSNNQNNNPNTNNIQTPTPPAQDPKPAPEPVITYYCPEGFNLEGTQCRSVIPANYVCPANTADYSTEGIPSNTYCVNLSEGYETETGCPDGYGSISIISFGAPTKTKCLPLHRKIYTCNDGYTLNETNCIKIINAEKR